MKKTLLAFLSIFAGLSVALAIMAANATLDALVTLGVTNVANTGHPQASVAGGPPRIVTGSPV
jgi:hypothetical protein